MNGNEQWGGYHVVLASASPRRKELLNQIGIFPEIRPSQMEEETVEKKPEQVVMELSRQKAEDIAAGCGTGTMVKMCIRDRSYIGDWQGGFLYAFHKESAVYNHPAPTGF